MASIGEEADIFATKLATELRNEGIQIEKDICSRSLNAKCKYANKTNAKYVLTIGENEVRENKAKIKNMTTGEETELNLTYDDIKKIIL